MENYAGGVTEFLIKMVKLLTALFAWRVYAPPIGSSELHGRFPTPLTGEVRCRPCHRLAPCSI
jgi:hypothetical protein